MTRLICTTMTQQTQRCQMCGTQTHVLFTVARTDDLAMDLCHSCYEKEQSK